MLNNYAGDYQRGNDTSKLVVDGDRLVGTTRNLRYMLEAETESDFYIKGFFSFMHFKKDAAGKIEGFQLEQFEGNRFVKKISK